MSYQWISGDHNSGRNDSGHHAVTMHSIATVRAWAMRLLGAASSELLIDREPGGKTNVRLRFFLDDAIGECDVPALLLIKRRGGKGLREMIRGVCRFDSVGS